jgi:hypothetical protein
VSDAGFFRILRSVFFRRTTLWMEMVNYVMKSDFYMIISIFYVFNHFALILYF